jgi:uncharacterized protein
MQPKHIVGIIIAFLCFPCVTHAQIRANFIEKTAAPSPKDLEAYRTAIWETLPQPDGWTNDYEGIFTNEEEQTLSGLIAQLEKKTGIEIAVVTVDSNMVSLEKFEDFAEHLLDTWGVGKEERDNGVVICISSAYKKITISRGVGIEKYLSGAMVKSLIAKDFVPLYRKYNYFGGTLSGLIALINKLQQ